LLPPKGLSTLGFDPARFQTEPPACYRASWQLLGRDSHPLATTSLCWIRSSQSTTSDSGHTDELGYLALPDGAAELVFQVISERNERASLICTTNLAFGEWTKVFPDARLAKAVVDRITHKAHIIDTGTESWRFRHGLQRKRA